MVGDQHLGDGNPAGAVAITAVYRDADVSDRLQERAARSGASSGPLQPEDRKQKRGEEDLDPDDHQRGAHQRK